MVTQELEPGQVQNVSLNQLIPPERISSVLISYKKVNVIASGRNVSHQAAFAAIINNVTPTSITLQKVFLITRKLLLVVTCHEYL